LIRLFSALKTGDEVLERIQSNIDGAFQRLLQVFPIVNGRLIRDVPLSTTATGVAHGLGRSPAGWIVVGKDAAEDVFMSASDNIVAERTLPLTATGTVTVSLWVF
jgi:hypothetical protein